MDYGLDRYSLDRGLDSITRTSRPEVPLPEAAQLSPAAQISRPELDKLLHRPNLQDYVAEQLQPPIADRQLLTPQLFERTLHSAVRSLRELAAQREQHSANSASAISKGARLLTEEANLRDLLGMYRSALYQG